MGAGVEVFESTMREVESDVRERYADVEALHVMDIDTGVFGSTRVCGVVSFSGERASMGFYVTIKYTGVFVSLSHEGQVEGRVILFEK